MPNFDQLTLRALAAVAIVAALAGCAAPPGPSPSYDPFTSRLLQLTSDSNADGRADQWVYMDGNRRLRAEADTDADGRVDRWEYYDAQAVLVRVGTSSRANGVEDTWTWQAGADGVRRVDLSRAHDRAIDRTEFFAGDALVRAEEDTNLDGRPDKWERYEAGVLRQVDLDITKAGAAPNRRLAYDAGGRFLGLSADDERDGTFVLVPGESRPDLVRPRP